MRQRSPAFCGLAFAVTMIAAAQRGDQRQSSAEQPIFRVSVDRIEISAVATDAKGRQVTDLGIGDFTVLDSGKPQQITSCVYIRSALPRSALRPSAQRHDDPLTPPAGVTRELTPEQVRRSIVFLIDDESFGPDTVPTVRRAVKDIIERGIQPGDLVAIIRTSSGSGSLEQFTSDKRVLLESCEKIRWRPGSRGNPGNLPQITGYVAGGARSGKYIVQRSAERTQLVLDYVISALRNFPGRKSIFFLSQSFVSGGSYAGAASGATDVGKLVDQALRAGVVIYGIDPTPLSSLTPGADYDLTGQYNLQFGAGGAQMGPQDAATLLNGYTQRALGLLESFRLGLRTLAEGTGGIMAADTDAAAALERFTDDLQGYYVLTYKPRNPERYFGVKREGPPPFRSIKIRAARPGVHARSYAGYIAEADAPEAQPSGHDAISNALFSPFSAAGIRVRLTLMFTRPQPQSPELNVLLHIDARDLSFAPGDDGRHNADFATMARVAGETGAAQTVTKQAVLRLEDSNFEEALRMGVTYRLAVPAKNPGLYEVRVAIRDPATGKVGSAREFVEVPDLAHGGLAVSGVLAHNADSRQRDAAAPGLAEKRRFRRQDRLSYACQVFNAKSVKGEIRIVQDGKQMSAAPAEISENGDGTSTAKGVVSLAPFAPGYYILQVVVRREGDKAAVTSQWTDFEVVP